MKTLDKLNVINQQAARQASQSLSKLIAGSVEVEIKRAAILAIEELLPTANIEEMVVGIHLPVSGDLQGTSLLTLPRETAYTLSDLLVKRPVGTTRKLTPLDESALMEVGNILVGSYLTILADQLQLKTIEGVPSLTTGMVGAIMDQILAKAALKAKEVLVAEVLFHFRGEKKDVQGRLILLFVSETLQAVLGALERA